MSTTDGGDDATKQVAVVVATHNRRHLLKRLLDALAAMDFDAAALEVVVVDDASSDGTFQDLTSLAPRYRFALDSHRLQRQSGPAAARNVGWKRATAPLVAFVDDDCTADRGWLAALVRAAQQGADVVQGTTLPDPQQKRGPFSHTMSVTEPSGRFETCNILYRRSLLESLGGFDEAFRDPYGEDTDLGIRAIETGASFAFAAEAVVHHDVSRSSLLDRVRGAPRLEGVVLAVARHPRLREQLASGMFTKPHHPHVLASVAGWLLLAGGRRSRHVLLVGLLLQMPFVWYRTFVEQLPARKWTWPVVLPAALVLDVVNLAALARASAKHRTLVL